MRDRYTTYGRVVAKGTVQPAERGKTVVIQRYRAGRWVSIGRAQTHRNGDWHEVMPNRQPGQWRLRSVTLGPHPNHGTRELSLPRRYVVRVVLNADVTRVTARQLGGSYHQGCPVGPSLLRNVRLTFKTYGATVNRGTLVVRSTMVNDVRAVWGRSLATRFPFRQIRPTAFYGGSDPKSMWHDNTSAFNCRHVTGDPTSLSPHSYGTAVDVNTVKNPYMDSSGRWWPRYKGYRYRNRSHPSPGMLFDRSTVTRMMRSRGFQWGGNWSHRDYQHFDPS